MMSEISSMRASTPAMIFLNDVKFNDNEGTCIIFLSLLLDDDDVIRRSSHLDLSNVVVLSFDCSIERNYPLNAPQVSFPFFKPKLSTTEASILTFVHISLML